MNSTLELIAILVSVVGGFKALEWIIEKITKQHDKSQKIDTNSENFLKFKEETETKFKENDERFKKLEKSVADAHNYAQKNLEQIKKEIVETITEHRNEYLQSIVEVKESITELSGLYQQNVAVLGCKIDALESSNQRHLEQLKEAQNKHNNLMERQFICEKQLSVLENREKVSEHRLDDLEKK